MSNEFKLVPVEPDEAMMRAALAAMSAQSGNIFQALKEGIAAAPQPPALGGEPDNFVREVFLRNGFTIKEGQSDLKPYVYAAAKELTAPLQAEIERLKSEDEIRQMVEESLRAENDQLKARCDEQAKALARLISVARTVNRNTASETRVPSDDEPQYRQRKEWIEYLLETCAEAEALSKPAGSEQV